MAEEQKKEIEKKPEKKEEFKLGGIHVAIALFLLYFVYLAGMITPIQGAMITGLIIVIYVIFEIGRRTFRKDVIEYRPLKLDEEFEKIKLFLLRFDGIRVLNFEKTAPEPELAEKSSEPYNQHWKLTCLARKYDYHKNRNIWKPMTILVSESAIMNGTITRTVKDYIGRETPSISWYGAKKYPSATEVTRYYNIKPAKIKAVLPSEEEERQKKEEEENE